MERHTVSISFPSVWIEKTSRPFSTSFLWPINDGSLRGQGPLCWACKQLGHIARTCLQKTVAIKTTSTTTSITTSIRTTTSITSSTAPEPEVHPNNQEKGWTLVTRKDKLSSHIFSYKTRIRNNRSNNRSNNNRNYYSPGNNNWPHNHSTFITPKTKKKGKRPWKPQ